MTIYTSAQLEKELERLKAKLQPLEEREGEEELSSDGEEELEDLKKAYAKLLQQKKKKEECKKKKNWGPIWKQLEDFGFEEEEMPLKEGGYHMDLDEAIRCKEVKKVFFIFGTAGSGKTSTGNMLARMWMTYAGGSIATGVELTGADNDDHQPQVVRISRNAVFIDSMGLWNQDNDQADRLLNKILDSMSEVYLINLSQTQDGRFMPSAGIISAEVVNVFDEAIEKDDTVKLNVVYSQIPRDMMHNHKMHKYKLEQHHNFWLQDTNGVIAASMVIAYDYAYRQCVEKKTANTFSIEWWMFLFRDAIKFEYNPQQIKKFVAPTKEDVTKREFVGTKAAEFVAMEAQLKKMQELIKEAEDKAKKKGTVWDWGAECVREYILPALATAAAAKVAGTVASPLIAKFVGMLNGEVSQPKSIFEQAREDPAGAVFNAAANGVFGPQAAILGKMLQQK